MFMSSSGPREVSVEGGTGGAGAGWPLDEEEIRRQAILRQLYRRPTSGSHSHLLPPGAVNTLPRLEQPTTPCPSWSSQRHLAPPGAVNDTLPLLEQSTTPCPSWSSQRHLAPPGAVNDTLPLLEQERHLAPPGAVNDTFPLLEQSTTPFPSWSSQRHLAPPGAGNDTFPLPLPPDCFAAGIKVSLNVICAKVSMSHVIDEGRILLQLGTVMAAATRGFAFLMHFNFDRHFTNHAVPRTKIFQQSVVFVARLEKSDKNSTASFPSLAGNAIDPVRVEDFEDSSNHILPDHPLISSETSPNPAQKMYSSLKCARKLRFVSEPLDGDLGQEAFAMDDPCA
ncbi:unnamed protein product [Cyprideis torosa]|uniref:Uncharacterized protein n=1 Tax=Cyprideis torosa TaxID=163714 RepID=A0A7R8WAR2_9CRUS|nr:unnamed protein product [Cyprideis torosa]CAG0888681.1 unnamed protein product [Cyprideis torosa]